MKILFVCTGNSCRSPMAEGYFKHLAEVSHNQSVEVASAGTSTIDGMAASTQAQLVMARFGASLAGFRSRRFRPEMGTEYDLIIAMAERHKRAILQLAPGAHVDLLLDDVDVPDPFGGTVEDYQECFLTMKAALDRLAERILKENNHK